MQQALQIKCSDFSIQRLKPYVSCLYLRSTLQIHHLRSLREVSGVKRMEHVEDLREELSNALHDTKPLDTSHYHSTSHLVNVFHCRPALLSRHFNTTSHSCLLSSAHPS